MIRVPSLILKLDFENNFNDSSGNYNHFYDHKKNGFVDFYYVGGFGKSVFLNNLADAYQSIYRYSTPVSNSITVAGWFKIPTFSSVLGNFINLFSCSPDPATSTLVKVSRTGMVIFHAFSHTTTGFFTTSTNPLILDKWHHIALVATKEGNANLYIDGLLDKTTTANSKDLGSMWCLGDLRPGRGYEQGNFYCSDFQIYSKPLPETDIRRIMLGLHPLNG